MSDYDTRDQDAAQASALDRAVGLLEALEEIAAIHETATDAGSALLDAQGIARGAIAKATGERQ